MTKEDYVWVGIKIIGICLLVLVLMNLKDLMHPWHMANKLSFQNSFVPNSYFAYKEATKKYFVDVVFTCLWVST